MVYLRKLLKKIGIIRVLELCSLSNSYLIELILIKVWAEIEDENKREELHEINSNFYLTSKNKIEIRKMSINQFSNMNISKEILSKYQNKEEELILLLIYEFLIDLLFPNLNEGKTLDLAHLDSDFARFSNQLHSYHSNNFLSF